MANNSKANNSKANNSKANNSKANNSRYPPFVFDEDPAYGDEEDQRERYDQHIEYLKKRDKLKEQATEHKDDVVMKDVVIEFIQNKEQSLGIVFLVYFNFYGHNSIPADCDKYCDLTMRVLLKYPDFNGTLYKKHKLFIIEILKEYNDNRDGGETKTALEDWQEEVESE